MQKSNRENLLVANGDTLFKINAEQLVSLHFEKEAGCTLSLKPMKDFDRYGVVELNEDRSIKRFSENNIIYQVL
jgi:D-glycero-alpha-D-manno-heptose 1-phosphate guanylyltransferase